MIRADGSRAARPSVFLSQEFAGGASSRNAGGQPDGTFSIANVPPGNYSIRVTPPTLPANAVSAEPQEYAIMPVQVNGDDISGLVITTKKTSTWRGQITFDTGAPPAGLTPQNIRLLGVGAAGSMSMSLTRYQANPDWTFELGGAMGPQVLRSSGGPGVTNSWFLKAVIHEGVDVIDRPLDGGDKDINDLQVALTQKRSEINGAVTDSRNLAVPAYVVVFAADRDLWTPESRFIGMGRPDQKGQFRIIGLPAGRYLAAAVEYIEPGAERSRDLLDRLFTRATPVTLQDAETKTLDLSLVTSY